MAASDYLLEMNGISKSFPGVKALDGVSLKVSRGPCTRSWARMAPASPRS